MILALVVAERNLKNAMVLKFNLFAALLFCTNLLLAQNGKVEIIEEPEIKLENERRIAAIDTGEIAGYRVQIYFGSDMYKADEQRNKFISMFPEYADQIYRKYERPYWKLRVGNFYREIDAQPLLKQTEKEFESVFLVKDFIVLPPLPKNQE